MAYLLAIAIPTWVAVGTRGRDGRTLNQRLGEAIKGSGLALMAATLAYFVAVGPQRSRFTLVSETLIQ